MLFDLADIHDVCTSRSATQTGRTDSNELKCNQQKRGDEKKTAN